MKFFAGPARQPLPTAEKLTPFVRAELDLSPPDRRIAGLPTRVYSLEEADIVTPLRVWSEYARSGDLSEPNILATDASRTSKPFVVWHTGDLNPILPFKDCVVMVNAVDRSHKPSNWHVAPRFIADPLCTFAPTGSHRRKKMSKPVVGFCGYAATNPFKLGYSVAANLKFRAMHAIHTARYEPPPVVPATILRAKVLKALRSSPAVETRFIVRSRYRTGTADEFYANILDTDYTVCVRGYGNWSVRLYETLACGRIPVFIDTDCTLPFDRQIDWKRYCVWVPANDIHHAGEYIADFHDRLSPRDLSEKQRECRRLWTGRLTLNGFLAHFHEHFD